MSLGYNKLSSFGYKMAKNNVVTIGAAFYYALQMISTNYLLFLENDFKMDVELSMHQIRVSN